MIIPLFILILGTDVEFWDRVSNDSNQKAQLIIVSRTSTDEFQQQQNRDLEDTTGKKINKLISGIVYY